MKTGNLWDIFCKVIDNYGDIGVCWRLAVGLAERGERVRLWVDDASALCWMAPEGAQGVEVRPWTQPLHIQDLPMGDIWIEAFGCDIPPEFIANYLINTPHESLFPVWINLEYLSAENYAKRCHGLPSPVMSGPGKGLTKHFFYPGFTKGTGGLLREADLAQRQARFNRVEWLQKQGIEGQDERLVSLFCYEPPALGELLTQLSQTPQATRLLVTAGRAATAVRAYLEDKKGLHTPWNIDSSLSISYLPVLTQFEYDHLLWACDLNFVRGEDSLVRAVWAGKPFVWHIYQQDDNAHHAKLHAFLDWLHAPASLRTFHDAWNGVSPINLPALDLDSWQEAVTSARQQLLQQDDLVTQLLGFTLKNL